MTCIELHKFTQELRYYMHTSRFVNFHTLKELEIACFKDLRSPSSLNDLKVKFEGLKKQI